MKKYKIRDSPPPQSSPLKGEEIYRVNLPTKGEEIYRGHLPLERE